MKVLFINQYYRPDMAATAMMLTDLAEHLAPRYDRIDVLCSRGVYNADAKGPLATRETLDGVNIRRLPQWGSRKKSSLSRGLEYLGFHAQSLLWMLKNGWKYDVIVTLTDPPLIGLQAVLFKWMTLGRVKHVHWSMDLFPDSVVNLGALSRRSPIAWALERLSRIEYRSADAVVPLGDCMRDLLIEKRVKPHRLRVIGVWSRADQVSPIPHAANPLRDRHAPRPSGGADPFVVMYSGNAGRAHAFDAVCDAMRALSDDPGVRFLFVGGGKALDDIRPFVRDFGVTGFAQLPYFPREQLAQSLSMADAHLVTLRGPMAGIVVPSKLYGIMASGRPILYVGPDHSTIARQVREADCGFVIAEGDAPGLVRAIATLRADPAMARRLGENGRSFFLARHEAAVCCDEWDRLLHEVAGRAMPAGGAPASATAPDPREPATGANAA